MDRACLWSLRSFSSFPSLGGATHDRRLHRCPRRLRPSRVSSLVARISRFALPFRGLWPSVKLAAFGFWISDRRAQFPSSQSSIVNRKSSILRPPCASPPASGSAERPPAPPTALRSFQSLPSLRSFSSLQSSEPDRLHLAPMLGDPPEDQTIALHLPKTITSLCHVGRQISLALGKTKNGWRILESGTVYARACPAAPESVAVRAAQPRACDIADRRSVLLPQEFIHSLLKIGWILIHDTGGRIPVVFQRLDKVLFPGRGQVQ